MLPSLWSDSTKTKSSKISKLHSLWLKIGKPAIPTTVTYLNIILYLLLTLLYHIALNPHFPQCHFAQRLLQRRRPKIDSAMSNFKTLPIVLASEVPVGHRFTKTGSSGRSITVFNCGPKGWKAIDSMYMNYRISHHKKKRKELRV